jgi:hypothetical protein
MSRERSRKKKKRERNVSACRRKNTTMKIDEEEGVHKGRETC